MTEDLQQLHAIIHGRVQGVGFRNATQMAAMAQMLTGWVRNNPDGTVEVRAEGTSEKLEKFLAYLHVGPLGARVEKVDAVWRVASGNFDSFDMTG